MRVSTRPAWLGGGGGNGECKAGKRCYRTATENRFIDPGLWLRCCETGLPRAHTNAYIFFHTPVRAYTRNTVYTTAVAAVYTTRMRAYLYVLLCTHIKSQNSNPDANVVFAIRSVIFFTDNYRVSRMPTPTGRASRSYAHSNGRGTPRPGTNAVGKNPPGVGDGIRQGMVLQEITSHGVRTLGGHVVLRRLIMSQTSYLGGTEFFRVQTTFRQECYFRVEFYDRSPTRSARGHGNGRTSR